MLDMPLAEIRAGYAAGLKSMLNKPFGETDERAYSLQYLSNKIRWVQWVRLKRRDARCRFLFLKQEKGEDKFFCGRKEKLKKEVDS